MKDYCIVLNPQARGARQLEVIHSIADVARDAEIRVTSAPHEAESLARQAAAEGFSAVIAAGGDGTVNEVLCGLTGTNVRLGVLPLGTMNVFARELGLHLDWENAWAAILRGRTREVDLGLANGLPFAQLAGVGFDADVVAGVTSEAKRRFGAGAYAWSALRQMGTPACSLKVEAAGLPPIEGVWVLVGNGRFYGGPFPVFPRAKNDDGLIDVLVLRDLTALDAAKYLFGVPLGWHTRFDGVSYLQTEAVTVKGGACFELDGEFAGRADVEFSVKPRAIRLIG
jgi:YegS/Rv2252/BmrU family lipid kinase